MPPPQNTHTLILVTCEYLKLQCKGGIKVADGIMLANQVILKWEDYPGLVRWAQCNRKCPYK